MLATALLEEPKWVILTHATSKESTRRSWRPYWWNTYLLSFWQVNIALLLCFSFGILQRKCTNQSKRPRYCNLAKPSFSRRRWNKNCHTICLKSAINVYDNNLLLKVIAWHIGTTSSNVIGSSLNVERENMTPSSSAREIDADNVPGKQIDLFLFLFEVFFVGLKL